MLATSEFFTKGMFKKAIACPEMYTKDAKPKVICGVTSTERGKWDPSASLGSCKMSVSKDAPMIAEMKFNGNRGIFEFRNGEGCFFTENTNCIQKVLPRETGNLLASHLKSKGIESAILDGEMFIEKCTKGGKVTIPNIGKQTEAIKGDHDDTIRDCIFTYKIFDVIQIDGKDVAGQPLVDRKDVLAGLISSSITGRVSKDPVTKEYAVAPSPDASKNVSIDPMIPVPWVPGTPAPPSTTLESQEDIVKFVCDVTRRGEEGTVIKDPKSKYDWIGKTGSKDERTGWWKLKDMIDIDAEVFKACLGNLGKTAEHALRYRNLHLGVCEDPGCTKLAPITDSGASLTTTSGDFSGLPKFDKLIHFPIVEMINRGTAVQDGTGWTHVSDATSVPTKMHTQAEFDKMTGGMIDPATGTLGLPQCVNLPAHSLIVSVVTTEVNPPKKGMKYPTLQGPPKLKNLRDDKRLPNTLSYVEGLIT